jgi:hypothetical protein
MSAMVITESLVLVAVDEISKYTPCREIVSQNMNFQGCRGEVSIQARRDYCATVVEGNRDGRRRGCNLPELTGKWDDVFGVA